MVWRKCLRLKPSCDDRKSIGGRGGVNDELQKEEEAVDDELQREEVVADDNSL